MDRRALKREYKESRPAMGVYRVRNTASDRSLVGSSVNVAAMLNRIRAQLKMGAHANGELQRDWNELGPDAFAFETLDTLAPGTEPGYKPTDDLRALEQMWLERLSPFGERGYNAPRR
jgi:hypothetical protein